MNSKVITLNQETDLTKICSRVDCFSNGKSLPITFFCKDSNKKDGLSNWCRECRARSSREWQESNREKHREYNKKYREANPEKTDARIRRWQAENIDRVRQMSREYKRNHAEEIRAAEREKRAADPKEYWIRISLRRCKHRAKKKGLDFSLTRQDLLPLPEFCSVFGIKLNYQSGPDKRIWASMDRIIPNLGYVSGNVRVISRAANMAKLDGLGDIVSILH